MMQDHRRTAFGPVPAFRQRQFVPASVAKCLSAWGVLQPDVRSTRQMRQTRVVSGIDWRVLRGTL